MPFGVNGKIVVHSCEVPMLMEGVERPVWDLDSWFESLPWYNTTVLVVHDWPVEPINCGDGWFATANEGTMYAWNEDGIKVAMERAARESRLLPLVSDAARAVGLFQQSSRGWGATT